MTILTRHLLDEATLFWSPSAQTHRADPEYAELIERIIAQVLLVVPARGSLAPDQAATRDQAISLARERLTAALDPQRLAGDGGPAAETIRRWARDAARFPLVSPVEPPPRSSWTGWPRDRWLVALAAEWFFVPYAQGLVAAIRYSQSEPVVDVRAALHTIWFSFADACPQLGRALGAVLFSAEGGPFVFAPIEMLLDTVLEAHLLDKAKRTTLVRSLAQRASLAFLEMEPDQDALRPLIRPSLELLREAGLAPAEKPLSAEIASERVSELLVQLEMAADDQERVRLRTIIEPLIERLDERERPNP